MDGLVKASFMQAAQRHPDGVGRVHSRADLLAKDSFFSNARRPVGHTSNPIEHIAGKLMHSPKPEVREIAAAALSDGRTSPKGPIAHSRAQMASLAAPVMHTGNAPERRVAASVLADRKTRTS
jgi:uncharacterized protein (DUF2336 family)